MNLCIVLSEGPSARWQAARPGPLSHGCNELPNVRVYCPARESIANISFLDLTWWKVWGAPTLLQQCLTRGREIEISDQPNLKETRLGRVSRGLNLPNWDQSLINHVRSGLFPRLACLASTGSHYSTCYPMQL